MGSRVVDSIDVALGDLLGLDSSDEEDEEVQPPGILEIECAINSANSCPR